jgi:ABC-type antimicrobial peptide transport system permease subunit
MTFVVRSAAAPEALAGAVRAAVAARDPELPVMDVEPLSRAVSDSLGPARLALVLLTFFAATAVVLSSLGLFAVLASSVQQRTREMGLRAALGARPAQVFGLVLKEGLSSAALGLAGGLAAAFAAAPFVARVVAGASGASLTPFLAAALLAAVSAAACALPAARAMRLSPSEALRSD